MPNKNEEDPADDFSKLSDLELMNEAERLQNEYETGDRRRKETRKAGRNYRKAKQDLQNRGFLFNLLFRHKK